MPLFIFQSHKGWWQEVLVSLLPAPTRNNNFILNSLDYLDLISSIWFSIYFLRVPRDKRRVSLKETLCLQVLYCAWNLITLLVLKQIWRQVISKPTHTNLPLGPWQATSFYLQIKLHECMEILRQYLTQFPLTYSVIWTLSDSVLIAACSINSFSL